MTDVQRRTFIASVSSVFGIGLAGCPGGEDVSDGTVTPSPSAAPEQTSPDTSSPEVFTDLTVETDRTRCPADAHWDQYYHRTPLPLPDRSRNVTRDTVGELARAYQEHVLTYVAVEKNDPRTPETVTPNEPAVPAFPEVALENFSATILVSFEGSFVVRTTYTRVIEGEPEGAYTVNYYFSRDHTIRAQAPGDRFPGPNPTKTGTILDC